MARDKYMKREIKFRAWDESISRIRKVSSINWFDEYIYVDETPSGTCSKLLIEGTPLMQYTGLKDKNGKEIYEDDIVRVKSFSEPIMWIRFDRGAFYLASKDKEEIADIKYVERGEIIGNIYSNPELIK